MKSSFYKTLWFQELGEKTPKTNSPPNTERYETKKKELSSWVKNPKPKFYLDKLKILVDLLQIESSQVQL